MPLWNTPDNVTSMATLFDYMNYVTGDFFGLMILIPLWIILLISFLRWRPEWAFASSSAACLVIAILMSILGIVGLTVILGFVILTCASAAYIWMKKSEY